MPPLSDADQRALLRIARQALEQKLLRAPQSPEEASSPSLQRSGGAFVTLHETGHLRGCIGRIESSAPLFQTVAACAVSAAMDDPRFNPVQPEEVPLLRIEISVLSPLLDISPEQIELGNHGLLISQGARRGLLLPQVPAQWGWDREQFLSQTCIKAGLPADAWRRGARIQAFTAQVFEEPTTA